MPPCSSNHSIIQLFRKNMPPILKPGTHNQKLVPHQSLMRPFVLRLGNKRWKETEDEKKEQNVAAAASNSGIWFRIFVCYRRAEIDMERGRGGKKDRREKRHRAVWACPLFACLSIFSISSAAAHPTTGRQISTEPRPRQNLQIRTYVTDMNIFQHMHTEGSLSFQLFS